MVDIDKATKCILIVGMCVLHNIVSKYSTNLDYCNSELIYIKRLILHIR